MSSKLVDDARRILREVLEAREQFIRSQGGVGIRTPYAVCLLPHGDNSFRVVTLNESLGVEPPDDGSGYGSRSGLTARMVRDLTRELVLVCGSCPAAFLDPEDCDDDELVRRLEVVLLVYPPVRNGSHYSFFHVKIDPTDLIVRPLVLLLRSRPPGWPP